MQRGHAYTAAEHLQEIKQLRCLLGTPEPRRKGGIKSAGGRVEEVERWKLTNVRAAECWEKGEQKKLFVGSHRNGGENVSEHVLQDRLSGSR